MLYKSDKALQKANLYIDYFLRSVKKEEKRKKIEFLNAKVSSLRIAALLDLQDGKQMQNQNLIEAFVNCRRIRRLYPKRPRKLESKLLVIRLVKEEGMKVLL